LAVKAQVGQLKRRERAQSVVEFALALMVILTIMMGIIEFGRLLQTWLTVQNAAQAAARFAITGQGYNAADPWDAVRLQDIKNEAWRVASSLSINPSAGPVQAGYFDVSVHASDPPQPTPGAEFPGGPNARVAVDVTYNHPLITPIVREIIPWIKLRAHAEMINERYRHPGYGTPPGELPPTVVPTPVRYYIAGFVRTSGGTPLIGVTMTGLPGSPSTDSDGFYWAEVPDGWSGTVTPHKGSYVFSPSSRTYTNITSDKMEQNYVGALP
jgi:Flp pilus assembly protein TadG